MQMDPTLKLRIWLLLEAVTETHTTSFFMEYLYHLNLTPKLIQMSIALKTFSSIIMCPIWGFFCGTPERIKIIALLFALCSLMSIYFEGFSKSFQIYMISRIFYGATRASLILINSLAQTNEISKSNSTAINSAFQNLGYLIGILIGGFTVRYGYSISYLINLTISFISFIFVLSYPSRSFLPFESKAQSSKDSKESTKNSTLSLSKAMLKDLLPYLIYHSLSVILFLLPQHGYSTQMNDYHKMNSIEISILLVSAGICSIISQLSYLYLSKIFYPNTFINISLLLASICTIFTPFFSKRAFIVTLLLGCFSSIQNIITFEYILKMLPEGSRGLINGINQSLRNLGLLLSTFFCPRAASIHHTLPFILPGLSYLCLIMFKPKLIKLKTD